MSPKGAQKAKDEDNIGLSLHKENDWADTYQFYLFENFWCPSIHFQAVNNFKKEFQAKHTDFVVASFPKSGTIWLKALTFSIVNSQQFSSLEDHHPLLSSNPHELVPFFEIIFGGDDIHSQILCLSNMAEPRIFGYWEESIARPDKVLFLKYDDLKEDTNFHVKSVANFLGCPFTEEEENNGVIENIIKLCSFEKMKDLEVNKSRIYARGGIEKKNIFRKGESGDWYFFIISIFIIIMVITIIIIITNIASNESQFVHLIIDLTNHESYLMDDNSFKCKREKDNIVKPHSLPSNLLFSAKIESLFNPANLRS
ncbi:hypothetical protein V8G54_024808 [Vigna mungo]|uniref:Sulfotransferase n=1 Tax=Vigna mungo TaxID=3915 RepID=A0AAQ3N6Y3_VIGMU